MRAPRLMHGKTSPILHKGRGLFAGLDNPFEATRYHSLIVERETLPDVLEPVAWTPEGELMGIKHRDHETWGVQFHPGVRADGAGPQADRELPDAVPPAEESRELIQSAIARVVARENLSRELARATMEQILAGEATPVADRRPRGRAAHEGRDRRRDRRHGARPCARWCRRCTPSARRCSTPAARAATTPARSTSRPRSPSSSRSCGVAVAKHGNRAVSSRTGSADVLESLGVGIDLTPVDAARSLDALGITFLFAPNYHGALRHAVGPRRELGVRTVFNVLGPLTNPAGATRQLLGVYSDHARAH